MILNLSSLQSRLLTIEGERGIKTPRKIFMDEEPGLKKIHQKIVTTFGADAYSRSQINIWLEKVRSGGLADKDASPSRRPALPLGPQLAVSLQKYHFAWVLSQHSGRAC
jgi:hypothetical protein